MKKLTCLLLCLCMITVFCVPGFTASAAAAQNLIQNGDFEYQTGFSADEIDNRIPGANSGSSAYSADNWYRSTTGNAVCYDAILTEGENQYAKIAHHIWQGADVKANTEYILNFKLRTVTSPSVEVKIYDVTANSIAPITVTALKTGDATAQQMNATSISIPNPQTTWVNYQMAYKTGALSATSKYALYFINNEGYTNENPLYFELDDVSMYAVNNAKYDDIDIDMSDDIIIGTDVTVSFETGKDDGYYTKNGDSYTAVPYDGNTVLGWYNSADDTLVTSEATATLTSGSYTLKFINNNLLQNTGYELLEPGTSQKGTVWQTLRNTDWVDMVVSDEFSHSGQKSLGIACRHQKDICMNLPALEADTYYYVSYYWMMPDTPITATPSAQDCYMGSKITDAEATSIDAVAVSGDYNGIGNFSFNGGEWQKTSYLLYTKDKTDFRMFMSFKSENGNCKLYLDELSIYKAPDQSAVAEYAVNVTAENGFAYTSINGSVKKNTPVKVIATGEYGCVFDGWYENGEKVSDSLCYSFAVTSGRNLVAKFKKSTGKLPNVNMDVNNEVTLQDVVALAQFVAGWDITIDESVADVDGKNGITLMDVTRLAQYVAGWDVEIAGGGIPDEDFTAPNLKTDLLAGSYTEFMNRSVLNQGNQVRIANMLRKAARGEDISFVAFGGSITEGAGSTGGTRYADLVKQWLQAKFPNITVNYHNAGIGSTTSLLGVHRMGQDVMQYNPDFVVVDFTTNDNGGDIQYQPTYEAILRTLLADDNAPGVLAVMFGAVNNYGTTNDRKENSQLAHLPSLQYYDVPTIDFVGTMWHYLDRDIVEWNDFMYDYIHPNKFGHNMVAGCINNYLQNVYDKLDSIGTTPNNVLTESFFDRNVYETATLYTADNYTPDTNTSFTPALLHGKNMKGWYCENGGTLTFKVTNSKSIAIFCQNKNGNGSARITINGKLVASPNCNNASDGGFLWISYNYLSDTPQDFEITITATGKFGVGPLCVTPVE